MSMPMGDMPMNVADLPVAAGPQQAAFDLQDAEGSWYDTGTDVSGTRSLAVALMPTAEVAGAGSPKVTTQSAPGSLISSVSGAPSTIVGDGFLTGEKLARTVNGDIPGLQKPVDYKGKTMGQIGDFVGANVDKMLDMARVRSTAHQLLKSNDPRNALVDALTLKFDAEMASQPADKPYAMKSSESGRELMKVLDSIRADSPDLLPVTINFDVGSTRTDQAHMVNSIIWPEGAAGMPYNTGAPYKGTRSVQLTKPGLYAFICTVHAYMIGAVVVADPLYPGVSLGKKLHLKTNDLSVPTTADALYRLVQVFFIITNPKNWQVYSATEDKTWDPKFAPVPVLAYDANGSPELVPNLEAYIKAKAGLPMTLKKADMKPSIPGVGELWIDTQMEDYAEKEKPGAATKFNVQTWEVERKISAPDINMNNPHNMWTDKDQKYLYQTEWFSHWLNVFDIKTGEFIRRFDVGPSPTHVMTEPAPGTNRDDNVIVALSGGDGLVELSPGGKSLLRRLPTGSPDEPISLPHAEWLSSDGKYAITPNQNLYNASVTDLATGKFRHDSTGLYPIATGMVSSAKKGYYADILGASITCLSTQPSGKECIADDGTKVHRKDMSQWDAYDPLTGPTGEYSGMPIQISCAPDSSACATDGIFGAPRVTVFDPKTDKIVKFLPCVPGCHGINYGAKKGGGYYAYIASKFANLLEVLDLDPNGDGNPEDAKIVGRIVTSAGPNTITDGTVVDLAGMGGEGVLPLPLVYEGWVERAPKNLTAEFTCRQLHPVKFKKFC